MIYFYKNIITAVILLYFKTVDEKQFLEGTEPPKKNLYMALLDLYQIKSLFLTLSRKVFVLNSSSSI